MRYIIHGAGAIGCLVGGLLADTGADVIFIARPEQASAINKRGITIHSIYYPTKHITNVKAVLTPNEITPQANDLLMLAVKSSQTNACIHDLHEVFPQDTPIFCVQNGVRNETVAAERFLHVYGVMVAIAVNSIDHGIISQTMKNNLVVGNYPLGCDKLAIGMAQVFSNAGFDTRISAHVMAAKWGKLILNCSNALLAITGHSLQEAYAIPDVALMMAELQEEGLQLASAANIPIEQGNSPLDVLAMTAHARQIGENALNEEAVVAAQNLPEQQRTYASTWFDLKLKRGETEAGYLNGEIILLGEKHGIATPINSLLLQVIDQMADQYLQPGHYSVAQLREMMSVPPA